MKEYDNKVDDSIVKELFYNKDKENMGYRELKRNIEEKHLKRKLSFETFDYHIDRMTMKNNSRYAVELVLNKTYNGIGKKGSCSLTDDTKRRCRLELPICKVDSEREKTYQLLFMYAKDYDPSRLPPEVITKYTFNTEEQFNSKIQHSREDFQITTYPSQPEDGRYFTRMLFERSYENILIGKWEYPNEGRCSYWYVLPGVSPMDFMKGTKTGMVFEHIQFTEPEIQKAFNLLEKEGLISKIRWPVLKLLGEDTRYDITDERLREFIKHCWEKLFGNANIRMGFTWRIFRNPSKEEEKWYKIVWGPKRANAHFVSYYNNLKSLKKSGKEQHNIAKKSVDTFIKNYDKSIPEEFNRLNDEYHDIIEKYPYPSSMLLELVYPQFLRELHETRF